MNDRRMVVGRVRRGRVGLAGPDPQPVGGFFIAGVDGDLTMADILASEQPAGVNYTPQQVTAAYGIAKASQNFNAQNQSGYSVAYAQKNDPFFAAPKASTSSVSAKDVLSFTGDFLKAGAAVTSAILPTVLAPKGIVKSPAGGYIAAPQPAPASGDMLGTALKVGAVGLLAYGAVKLLRGRRR